MPEVPELQHLLNYFFRMGPATKEGPLDMREVRSWAPVLTGSEEWAPWQAELFVHLSRDYCVAQQEATDPNTPPPWPEAVKMWAWVQNQKAEKHWDRAERLAEQRMQK